MQLRPVREEEEVVVPEAEPLPPVFLNRRGFGRCCLLLQLGQILILQFNQFLQVANILLKTGQSLVGFLESLFFGNQIFFTALGRRTDFDAAVSVFETFS